MNTGNWTKLYGNTIYSTVWQEPPPIRCVWITMLAIADFEGYVGASVPGLQKASNVTLEETLAALERFQSPDPYSRTKEHDGRRIEELPGGWRILNFVAHRDGNEEQRERWAKQKRKQRAKKKQAGNGAPLAGEATYEKILESEGQQAADDFVDRMDGRPPEADAIPGPCSYCGASDHWRPDCPKIKEDLRKKGIPRSNQAMPEPVSPHAHEGERGDSPLDLPEAEIPEI